MTESVRSVAVDRSSPVPLWFQVAQQLQRAIEAGAVPQGARLDNELDLAEQLGLSRPTVRRAIQYLVDRGLVVRKRGVGTRVAHAKVKRPIELSSLYEDLLNSGQEPTTAVLSNVVEPAGRIAARELGLVEGEPVIALERLRFARGEPIARLFNYLPATVPGITNEALEQHGLYEILRVNGIRLRAAVQTIGARTADRAEAALLSESRRAPLLTMQRTAYDDLGQAVEYGSHIYRASRYYFEQHMVAQ